MSYKISITPILGDGINPRTIMFLAFLGQGLFVIPWVFVESKWMFYLVGIIWAFLMEVKEPFFQ